MCSEPSEINSEPTSLNDLPAEILLKIFSHFGPKDLFYTIAKVCERWNILAKDVLWKKLSYKCNCSSDSHMIQVRRTALLGFRTN